MSTTASLSSHTLAEVDPEIAKAIANEGVRQHSGLELIASENFVSRAILEATGSVFTNKYAEGYPGRRYYGGCEYVDVVESLAIDRAKALFGAEHANVQPHSGAQANMAVFLAVLKPGDTILGMNLAHGGHLTHGHPLNFSGKYFNVVPYGVRKEDERLDYDELARAGPRAPAEADHRRRQRLSARVRLRARPRGRRRGRRADDDRHGAHRRAGRRRRPPVPVPHSDFVTTTTHKTLRGPRGGHGAVPRGVREGSRPRGVPRRPGRAAGARHRRQGRLPQGGGRAGLRGVPAADRRQREAARRGRLAAGGYRLVSGGTDNHLMLVDVFSKGLTGKVAEAALGKAGITVNKNAIPFDQNPPMVASGIRIGTPAVTTRGMGEREMDRVGELILRALAATDNDTELARVKGESSRFASSSR